MSNLLISFFLCLAHHLSSITDSCLFICLIQYILIYSSCMSLPCINGMAFSCLFTSVFAQHLQYLFEELPQQPAACSSMFKCQMFSVRSRKIRAPFCIETSKACAPCSLCSHSAELSTFLFILLLTV